MASASITITFTDSTVTLADMRDTLCTQWGYTGLPGDNVAKLAFLKAYLISHIRTQYTAAKFTAATTAVNNVANGVDLS